MCAVCCVAAQGRYGFDWPSAFDLFTCVHAHSDIRRPETLLPAALDAGLFSELSAVVCEHFAFRYWSYYSDPAHLAHFLAPLWTPLIAALRRALHAPTGPRLALFSGHDINLFALLLALGEPSLVAGVPRGGLTLRSLYDFWPDYGECCGAP